MIEIIEGILSALAILNFILILMVVNNVTILSKKFKQNYILFGLGFSVFHVVFELVFTLGLVSIGG